MVCVSMERIFYSFSWSLFHVSGWLVVRELPRFKLERLESGRISSEFCGRNQLVHVDRIQLLAQEDSHENEATNCRTNRYVYVSWRGHNDKDRSWLVCVYASKFQYYYVLEHVDLLDKTVRIFLTFRTVWFSSIVLKYDLGRNLLHVLNAPYVRT